jgi:hypothetical protein
VPVISELACCDRATDSSSLPLSSASLLLAGCLIPYSVNPMSCFSFSLPLAIRGGYWHPQIFMDDVGYLLTLQIGSQQRVRIRCLPVPVLSGPTSGATWSADVFESVIRRAHRPLQHRLSCSRMHDPLPLAHALLPCSFLSLVPGGTCRCAAGRLGLVSRERSTAAVDGGMRSHCPD